MRLGILRVIVAFVAIILFVVPVPAQEDSNNLPQVAEELSSQVAELKNELSVLRLQLNNQQQEANRQRTEFGMLALVLFLSGAFCALWAQDSGRKPWFWFVVGFIFPVLTVIALLVKNSEDIRKEV